ncbi:hypothetical protein C2G38_2032814 [Gigaspora rosea]|uniref:Uncharacterized protein n=1 Tax=Gigaspora rosea TaxID=44941 RepID=A0A397VN55_9GLOM|nr:hypothetical protein C2G38_2032814 [Gigaspora rosea]
MNPITFNEYENYKEAQKKVKKDVQWHEFLKLDKKQYLNFRYGKHNDTTKSILDQSDTDETDNLQDSLDVDQEKNKVTKAKAKERAQPPKKKPIQPPIRSDTDKADNVQDSLDVNQEKKKKVVEVKAKGCVLPLKKKKNAKRHNGNMNSINIESDHNQSDTDETDNAQDSFGDNNNSGKRKRVQKAKEPSSHKARVTKKTKKSKN